MTPLERELIDLGDHLDHGDAAGLVDAVRSRAGAARRPSLLARTPVRVALVSAVVIALVLLVPPSRRAVARLLGIGGVEILPVPTTVLGPGTTNAPAATVPGAPSGSASTAQSTVTSAVTSAGGSTGGSATGPSGGGAGTDAPLPVGVTFAVRKAGPEWGPLRRADTDDRVPGGLVALAYDRFTLVELASDHSDYPVVGKFAPPGVTVSFVDVGDVSGVWLDGAHEITYLAPDGTVRQDTVRRAGSVLLWVQGGVTYRVEGLDWQADALAVAASLR